MNESPHAYDPADAPNAPVLRQIGTHLRLAREERGEELRDVAAFLRIRRAYLEGLEAGELERIPGRTYALGFMRSYADHLGFDGEAIVEEIKRTDAQLPQSPTLRIREPLTESQRPPLLLVATSILFAAMIYLGWHYWQDARAPERLASPAPATAPGDDVAAIEPPRAASTTAADALATGGPATDRVDDAVAGNRREVEIALPPLPPVPEPPMGEVRELAAAPAATEVTAAADDDAASIGALLEAPAPAADETGGQTGAAFAAASPRDGAAAAASSVLDAIAAADGNGPPRTFGEQDAAGRVVLFASEASWVQIRSDDRAFVWTRTMEPGDAYFVPNREDLALWTGNAGGLKVIVDGTPLAELGARGEVRRDIPLAADRLTAQYARE